MSLNAASALRLHFVYTQQYSDILRPARGPLRSEKTAEQLLGVESTRVRGEHVLRRQENTRQDERVLVEATRSAVKYL